MASATSIYIAELQATVFTSGAPQSELDALPSLYGNLGSTEPYMRIYDRLFIASACVLHDPHHVLVFRKNGRTVDILNRACDIPPRDVERACQAIFEAFADVRRIHVEVLFDPVLLRLPTRFLRRRLSRVIELPGGPDEYLASLGTHSRRNLRSYERRWSRDHPDTGLQVVKTEERAGEFFELFRTWKCQRFAEKGRATHWDETPGSGNQFVALLRELGEAQIVFAGGEPVGIIFFFQVGSTIDSNEGAYDTRYEPYALGTLMHYWMAVEAARRGAARVCLGPGPNQYFRRFGSTTRPATTVSVFRSDWARLDSLDEAASAARRRLELAARTSYWKTRHAAGTALRKTTGWPPGEGDRPS